MKKLAFYTSTISDGDMKYAENASSNRSNFLNKVGISQQPITLQQFHSSTIHDVIGSVPINKRGDGMFTDSKDKALGVYTADCLPIAMIDSKKNSLILIHAGYKGILKLIHRKALKKMMANSSTLKDTQVYIGPGIGKCCYDISKDRLAKFVKLFEVKAEKRSGKIFISLSDIVKEDLTRLGVKEKNIHISGVCTKCSKKYFSYRRHNKITGLNLTIAQIS